MRRESIAPASLLAAVLDPYRLGLGGRITIDLQVPPDLPHLWVDPTLLSRALTNLLENAIQAMPAGGRLTVRAETRGDAVAIEVSDTGVGMDAEASGARLRAVFLDEDRRLRSGVGQRQTDRRAARWHRLDRQRRGSGYDDCAGSAAGGGASRLSRSR